MEIPVTLVPSIDAQAWPNEIYVGYAYEASSLCLRVLL